MTFVVIGALRVKSYVQSFLNMHTHLPTGIRGLIFCVSCHLFPYFRKGSDKVALFAQLCLRLLDYALTLKLNLQFAADDIFKFCFFSRKNKYGWIFQVIHRQYQDLLFPKIP